MVDVPDRVGDAVRSSQVAVLSVVKRLDALVRLQVWNAGQAAGVAGEAWDPIGTGVGAEIGVERAILLHDDHDVLDLVNRPWDGPLMRGPVLQMQGTWPWSRHPTTRHREQGDGEWHRDQQPSPTEVLHALTRQRVCLRWLYLR